MVGPSSTSEPLGVAPCEMLILKHHCCVPRKKHTTPFTHLAKTCNTYEGRRKNNTYSQTYRLTCLVCALQIKRLVIHAWGTSLKIIWCYFPFQFLLMWSQTGQCTCCLSSNVRWPVKTVNHEHKNLIWEFWKVSWKRKGSSIGFVMSPAAAPATKIYARKFLYRASSYVYKQ